MFESVFLIVNEWMVSGTAVAAVGRLCLGHGQCAFSVPATWPPSP